MKRYSIVRVLSVDRDMTAQCIREQSMLAIAFPYAMLTWIQFACRIEEAN
jgi:hypothetical protein